MSVKSQQCRHSFNAPTGNRKRNKFFIISRIPGKKCFLTYILVPPKSRRSVDLSLTALLTTIPSNRIKSSKQAKSKASRNSEKSLLIRRFPFLTTWIFMG